MTQFDHDRTLAIMMKAPRTGHVKTRLESVYPPGVVVQLYRALIEDSIDLGRRVGARIAAVCPAGEAQEIEAWLSPDVHVMCQRGNGLADGLASVFELLCDPPRRMVIAFNGDGPHLPPAVLETAFAALGEHDVVLGPCDDGGYYLVGATRSHPELFDPHVMGTGSAFETLAARTRRLGLSSFVTPEHYDVDLPQDLARLARELTTCPARAPRTATLLARIAQESAAASPGKPLSNPI